MPDYVPRPGFTFPGIAPREAIDYFEAKGWKVGFSYQDVWAEEHAFSFTVAKAMQMEVLEAIRDEVENALREGVTFEDFRRNLTPRLREMGWWGVKNMEDPVTGEVRPAQLGSPRRLRVIYDRNLRTARAAGQWARIERSRESLPYLLYALGPSREHRLQHVAWTGTMLPSTDPWWRTHNPPNGWG